jgi:RNA polymerase sigma factor (sigma-70 family)
MSSERSRIWMQQSFSHGSRSPLGRGPGRTTASRSTQAITRAALADIRLQREYDSRRRRLVALARRRYRLSTEDCEEIVDDTLLAWHRQLCTTEGVGSDRAFCEAVLRARAIDRLRSGSVQAVELSNVESVGMDPQLYVFVAEREETQEMRELAREVLKPREYESLVLAEYGLSRAELADRFDLNLKQVKRLLARARQELETAYATMRQHGRCAMLALTIADIKAGGVRPGDSRWTAGVEHLARCRRCRTFSTINSGPTGR